MTLLWLPVTDKLNFVQEFYALFMFMSIVLPAKFLVLGLKPESLIFDLIKYNA